MFFKNWLMCSLDFSGDMKSHYFLDGETGSGHPCFPVNSPKDLESGTNIQEMAIMIQYGIPIWGGMCRYLRVPGIWS